jgi:hypothetical protein
VNITGEQVGCTLTVKLPSGDSYGITGTDDIEIGEEAVYDIKSASDYAFRHKFTSYESLRNSDDFGYIPQLYGYAAARNLRAGGWIIINKNSGEIRVLEVDTKYAKEDARNSLNRMVETAQAIKENTPFKRNFDDVEETWYGKPTGNRYLDATCSFCSYKFACWLGLKHAPMEVSKAKDKTWKYYTVLRNKDD